MTWEKGKSGNPGGLTLRQSRTKRLIEGLGPVAVARLEQLLRSDNETVALGAAKEVLARVAPIPKQAKIDVSVEHGPNAHLAALIALARKSPISGHALPNETPTPMLDITPKLGNEASNRVVNGHNEQIDPLAVLHAQTEQVIEELVDDAEDEDNDPI
jgi:hypothetical protein